MTTPVTLVTGFLGAGKSTLLNRLVAAAPARHAVIVNEFGDVGIDGELIDSGEEELIELASGCLCCTVRGDLIRTLRGLLKRRPDLDGVLIETTGLADPAPVIQTFAADRILASLARLDAVVTVADAVHVVRRLADSPEAADQIALASTIVLNKISDASDPGAARAAIRALNPHAPILEADRARVDPAAVLGSGGYALDRVAADIAQDHGHGHIAASGIAAVAVETDAPLDRARLEGWLERLLMLRGEGILRLKGILDVAGEDRPVVLQAVHMMHEGDFGPPWGARPRRSKLVVIGRGLDRDEIETGLLSCRATETA